MVIDKWSVPNLQRVCWKQTNTSDALCCTSLAPH
jgi:hypothetical protein